MISFYEYINLFVTISSHCIVHLINEHSSNKEFYCKYICVQYLLNTNKYLFNDFAFRFLVIVLYLNNERSSNEFQV